MLLKQFENEEPRYDAATLKKVAALAERLQHERRETLSAREIESIGTEAGLQPAFVRAALAQITAEQEVLAPESTDKGAFVGIGLAAAFFSLFTYSVSNAQGAPSTLLMWCWLVLPVLLPALVGFATKRSKLGLVTGLAIIHTHVLAGCILSMQHESANGSEFWQFAFFYALLGALLAGGTGWFAGWLRERPKGKRKEAPPQRQELLGSLLALQQQLEGPKVHRTFLSIDVAGTAELKRGETELTVEYSFSEFRQWVEEIASAHGGQTLPSVTEGVLCVFPDGTSAARAARQVQDTLRRFNDSSNRLSRPFRVRCGISGGEIAAGSLQSDGRPRSWLVDHAISLQRTADPGDILISESAAGPALGVLGSLARAAQPVEGEPAFTWRGAGNPQPVTLA